METQIRAQSFHGLSRQLRLHSLHKLRLRHIQLLHAGSALHSEIVSPLNTWCERCKLLHRHHVVNLVRIAPFHACQRPLRQRRLNVHDRVGIGLRLLRRFAFQRQQRLDVVHVLLAQLHALSVGLQVIVAVRQPQPARTDLHDDHGRINGILPRPRSEEKAAGVPVVQIRQRRSQVLPRLQSVQADDCCLNRCYACCVDRFTVHARIEEVSDLLLHRRARRAELRVLLQNAPKKLLILGAELAVDAPRSLVSRDRILGDPSAA